MRSAILNLPSYERLVQFHMQWQNATLPNVGTIIQSVSRQRHRQTICMLGVGWSLRKEHRSLQPESAVAKRKEAHKSQHYTAHNTEKIPRMAGNSSAMFRAQLHNHCNCFGMKKTIHNVYSVSMIVLSVFGTGVVKGLNALIGQLWRYNMPAVSCRCQHRMGCFITCTPKKKTKTKLHGLSPRANYTDRATADCRRSDCHLLRIEGCHVVSVSDPNGRILCFLDRSRYFSTK
jgi:hypothetical protein